MSKHIRVIASRGFSAHYVHTFPAWLYSLLRAHRDNNFEMKLKNRKRVVFYLEHQHKELLFNQCSLIQVAPSFYVRNCVLEKLGKPALKVQPQNLDSKEYISELIRVGVNLNQIAKKLNSGVKFITLDELKLQKQIENLTNQILEIQSKL